jgi:hypothetical protein
MVLDNARAAFEEEELDELSFGAPIASGDRAPVAYWAILAARGKELTLAGITMFRFAEDGRVRKHHECWAMDEGRRAPPGSGV